MNGMRSSSGPFNSMSFFTGAGDNTYVAASLSLPGEVLVGDDYMTAQEAVNLATALLFAASQARENAETARKVDNV